MLSRSWLTYLKEEWRLIKHDKSILLTCLVAPLFYAYFIGSIYQSKEVTEIPLAVVNLDKSQMSHTYIRFLDSNERIQVSVNTSYPDEAKNEMYQLGVHGILIIPSGFSEKVQTIQGADLELWLNNTRFLISNELNKAVQTTTELFSGGVRVKLLLSKQIPEAMALTAAQPIQPAVRNIFNPTGNYGDFLLPILLVLILQQTLVIAWGQSVVLQKKEAMLHSKARSVEGIWKRSFFYFLLYSLYFLIFFTILFSHYQLEFRGSLWFLIGCSLLFSQGIILATLWISSFFSDERNYTEVMAFSTYPIFLVSGYSWPLEAMPTPLQFISQLLPSTPFYQIFNTIALQGGDPLTVKNDLIHLLLLVLMFGLLAWSRNNKLKTTSFS